MLYTLGLALGMASAFCIGLIFIVAGVGKLRHRHLLPGVIANYRLLPQILVQPASVMLPFGELAVGIALIAGESLIAPLVAQALLILFAIAMGINIKRGRRHIDCGCGHSELRQQLGWHLVVRNVALAASLTLRLIFNASPGLTEIIIAAASGISLYLAYLLFNLIASLSSTPLSQKLR